jgi:hypothetical protein
VSEPGTSRSIRPRWGRIAAALLALVAAIVLIVVLGPWGGDDAATATAGEGWGARANAYCADGIQEASALTPPSSATQAGADAAARIAIVATVRDGIYTLGEPAELDSAGHTAYVDSLTEDLDRLDEIRKAARSGGDYRQLSAGFEEASGEPVSQLDLDDCAEFAQAIRPPPG